MSNVDALVSATTSFNKYTPMPVFVLGLFGNLMNLLIFRRRSLVNNPCTIYLFSATIMNTSILFFGLLIRTLMDGFDIDIVGNNLVICRLRYILLHPSYVLSSWFLVCGSIDRFCISSRSARLRNFSNMKNARRTVLICICIGVLLYCHVIILFDIENRKSGPYCYAQVGLYRVIYDFLFFASFSLLPPFFMMIVGLLTVRNVRLVRVRTGPTTSNVSSLNRKDRQLILMLLIQLISTIICTLPHAIQKLYATFTVNDTKDAYRLAIESLVSQLTRQLLYINASIGFYLYISLSSSAFRQEFYQIIRCSFDSFPFINRFCQNKTNVESQGTNTIQMNQ
ncbi:hypothetical protein I4U23_011759 [Adineta vaga]|nr:hypothetical protein I4U23_011759 [Adineta vaga]